MRKPQIGLIGCFQNGKSTLVNCLLGNRVAITGEGVAKTKKIARYVHGNEAGFYSISPNGQRNAIGKEDIYNLMLNDAAHDGMVCEMSLPSPLLKKVDIVDTPGFDAAQVDTSVTTGYIPQLDFIFFVIGRGSGGGGLNMAEKSVLAEIVRQNKPFSVLFNCRDLNQWNPQEENVRCCINELTAAFQNSDIRPYRITAEDFILPVNLAWYWQSLVKQGLNPDYCFFKETEAEKTLLRRVRNYFHDDYEGLPSVEELNQLSNIGWVKQYITAPQNVIATLTNAIPAPVLQCSLTGTSVHVSWNATDPTHIYELSYCIQGKEFWTTLETTNNEKTISSLTEGQTYKFRVRAVANDRHSVSEFSKVKCVTVPKKKITVTYNPTKNRGGMLDDLI
ncbi:MAG: dynamin family protein [Planctomycetia bacterium]|nr:dynamin family protein [Planctomycetia bacterium]